MVCGVLMGPVWSTRMSRAWCLLSTSLEPHQNQGMGRVGEGPHRWSGSQLWQWGTEGTWDVREEAGGGGRWLGREAGVWLCLEQRRQVTRWSWPLPGGDLGFLGWLVCSPQPWLGPFHIWVRVWGLSRHRLSSGCCAWPGHLWFYAADIDCLPATCQAEFQPLWNLLINKTVPALMELPSGRRRQTETRSSKWSTYKQFPLWERICYDQSVVKSNTVSLGGDTQLTQLTV